MKKISLLCLVCCVAFTCCSCDEQVIVRRGLDSFRRSECSHGLTSYLIPCDLLESHPPLNGDYYYFDPVAGNGCVKAIMYLKYSEEMYADAKQYCFDNMLLGATRSISFESFTFLDNVSLDLIYPQRGYPYRFNLFAYSDSLCTLLFLGYYSSNDAQQIERKLAETAFPEFISLVYSDCFSSASQLVD